MEISEAAQEILEKLWTEIVEGKNEFIKSKNLGRENIIKELAEAKYITLSNNMVKLTKPKGLRAAKRIIIRHRNNNTT
jgi:Mn-dependent DtxR family transcriptional regulator